MNTEPDVTDQGFVGASTSTEVARIQADAVAVAKYEMVAMFEAAMRKPRDENVCIERLMTACKRPGFADAATWSFPRGGQQLSGPSVQLARGIAQAWGNIRKGQRILGMDDHEIHLGAFAHDVERGLLETAEAKVKKLVQRKNKKTGVTEWVAPDERDLRELVNRHSAILERNCLLKIVPADVVDLALERCAKTLLEEQNGKLSKNREDTIRDIVLAFAEFGVKREHLEGHIGHTLDTIAPEELVSLRNIYRSIKDGNTRTADHFDLGVAVTKPAGDAAQPIDLSKAKSVPPKDPAGGSPLKDAAPPVNNDTFDDDPKPSSEVPPEVWAKGIRIDIKPDDRGWLGAIVSS
jgi:hypothetical protein